MYNTKIIYAVYYMYNTNIFCKAGGWCEEKTPQCYKKKKFTVEVIQDKILLSQSPDPAPSEKMVRPNK